VRTEIDGTCSESCSGVGIGISGDEPSDYITTVLVETRTQVSFIGCTSQNLP
jgi:hypothetical protein